MSTFEKLTLVPLNRCDWELQLQKPFVLCEGVTVENVQGLLTPKHFDLWHERVSADERMELAKVRIALVHRFKSSGHIGKEESDSHDLLYRVFICLRLIKPTKMTHTNIQIKLLEGNGIEVFSFSRAPVPIANVPEAEAFNTVGSSDLTSLGQIAQAFLNNVDAGPIYFRRALRHWELGYTDVQDAVLQIITWVTAIEQFYSKGTSRLNQKQLSRAIERYIGIDQDIYANSDVRVVAPSLPSITVRDTVNDLFRLRNQLIHGLWLPKEWLEPHRDKLLRDYGNSYAEVLREVASYILRLTLQSF